jgi:hypothetical protein
VAAAAHQILDDQKVILDAVEEIQIASNQIPAILHNASSWSGRLQSESERSAALSALVERVELGKESFRLALNLPISLAESPTSGDPTCLVISRLVPLQMKRRGIELRLVIGGNRGRALKADPVC